MSAPYVENVTIVVTRDPDMIQITTLNGTINFPFTSDGPRSYGCAGTETVRADYLMNNIWFQALGRALGGPVISDLPEWVQDPVPEEETP